jgi:hypothetical protein
VAISQKREHGRKKLSLQEMITSTSCIYDKIFRLVPFEIDEIHKVQFGCKGPPEPPIWTLSHGFQNFLDSHLYLQVQVIQTQKVSFHSEKVNVNSDTFSKESSSTVCLNPVKGKLNHTRLIDSS